jgi:hypothetical protein
MLAARLDTIRSGPDDCWVWRWGTLNGYGYHHHTRVHRAAYERWVGPIPDGLDLDHLCRNRLCANPAHLEPVTRDENLRRGEWNGNATVCVNGHPLTPENTWQRKGRKGRVCRTCSNARLAQRRQRRLAAGLPRD